MCVSYPSQLWEKPVCTRTFLRVCCGETVTYKEPALQRLAVFWGGRRRGVYENMPQIALFTLVRTCP